MISFYFSLGKNNQTDENLCSNDDYGKFIKIFNSFDSNVDSINITVFTITEEDL